MTRKEKDYTRNPTSRAVTLFLECANGRAVAMRAVFDALSLAAPPLTASLHLFVALLFSAMPSW